ncbi:MAG: hypothetical protein WB421_06690, partial [Terriglobales bacterium]
MKRIIKMFFNASTAYTDTNGLWLQISNVANGQMNLNLMNATDLVYEVMAKPNLGVAGNWSIAGEVFPGVNTNAMPFTVPMSSPTNLFVWALDWTGITSGGNTTPEWWFYYFYGTTNLSDSTLDSQGNTLGYDYSNNLDPNVISFTLSVTNDYVQNLSAPVTLNIAAGVPSYYAVLVNDTNLADANWQPYASSNLSVLLGLNDGTYNVSVGLRGLPANATQTWQGVTLTKDTVAPQVVISNPIIASGTATVIKPYLQLQGCASEQLSSLAYDISNATGLVTNQPGYVTGQFFDTNQFDFTTNYFQAYDVPLTNGVNALTLRVSDRAGNLTTTNFNVTLDYSTATNPPVVNVIWPQDGMEIAGGSFTLRGTMSDETGTVMAQIVDGDGDTNSVTGTVERNGMFWAEDLPLGDGDNTVTLTATDAAGNVTTTNLTVYESDGALTIDSTPTGAALYQAVGTVYGTVGDAGWSVTVNGVGAEVDEDGNWEADNVPIAGQGTATFDAVATPPAEGEGMGMRNRMSGTTAPPANASQAVELSAQVVVTSYQETNSAISTNPDGEYVSDLRVKNYQASYQTNGWLQGYAGTMSDQFVEWSEWESDYAWSSTNAGLYYEADAYYPDDGPPQYEDSTNAIGGYDTGDMYG